MSYLTDAEAAAARADVLALITSTGETAVHWKPNPDALSSFAGRPGLEYSESDSPVPMLLSDKQPADLLQVDHDYMVSVPWDSDLAEGHLLEFRGAQYEVVDIQRINLFGTVTHLEVAVKLRRGS